MWQGEDTAVRDPVSLPGDSGAPCMGVGSEPMPLVGRWAGHPSQLPAFRLFPELGFLLACRQEQPPGPVGQGRKTVPGSHGKGR